MEIGHENEQSPSIGEAWRHKRLLLDELPNATSQHVTQAYLVAIRRGVAMLKRKAKELAGEKVRLTRSARRDHLVAAWTCVP